MRARSFLKTRFRAVAGEGDEGDHWLGGQPFNPGALCPVCRIPLLLIWDLNCRDARFPRRRFGPLQRLPLYFCWGCVSDLAYRVLPDGELHLFVTETMRSGPSFQYEPYPSHFERRPLAFVSGIPDAVRTALTEWNPQKDPLGQRLTKKHRGVLDAYFGHPVNVSLSLFHSQLGGRPTKNWWGSDAVRCPNPECSPGLLGKLRGNSARKMSFLAGVLNDPHRGLPMVDPIPNEVGKGWNYFVSVEFQICGGCFTIHACNRGE